ncbi:MAG: hypothetical protein M3Q69_06815 [Acidobacteriota bacterium]|nr:hypothetical protein [Acidobacteriota bacterium]
MIPNSDVQATLDRLDAEDRARLGALPTAEEIVAYTRGELSGAEEERIREWIVCEPELARAVALEYPADDTAAVSEHEVASHWRAFQKDLPGERPAARGLRFYQAATVAMAAMLVLAFGALLRQQRQITAPRVITDQTVLYGDTPRGPAGDVPSFARTGGTHLLIIAGVPDDVETYRVEIRQGARVVWQSSTIGRADADGSITVSVPDAFLEPGSYRVAASRVPATTNDPFHESELVVRGR